jgi:hypothetical protein
LIGDNPNLPMGGHAGYGEREEDYPSVAAFREAQRLAVLERYTEPGKLPKLYDCEICCSGYHPDRFYGDCRQDLLRIEEPDELFGRDGWIEIAMGDAD